MPLQMERRRGRSRRGVLIVFGTQRRYQGWPVEGRLLVVVAFCRLQVPIGGRGIPPCLGSVGGVVNGRTNLLMCVGRKITQPLLECRGRARVGVFGEGFNGQQTSILGM